MTNLVRDIVAHLANFPPYFFAKHFTIEKVDVDGEEWIVFGNRIHTTFPTVNADAVKDCGDYYLFIHLDPFLYHLDESIRQLKHKAIRIFKHTQAGRMITRILSQRRYWYEY